MQMLPAEAQDMYGEKMEQFVKEAESQVTELTGRMKEAKTKLNALVVHFAEDPNKVLLATGISAGACSRALTNAGATR